ncbi:MAG: LamG-like jellyroll fold domain-containing protein, partial [Planctomycetota bacterium]
LLTLGTLPPGITVTSQSATSLTLGGTATLADYESAIEAIQFSTTHESQSPPVRLISVAATDSVFNTNTATASISITPVNDAPIADDDSATTNEDTALNVNAANGLLNGDSDPEWGTVSIPTPTHDYTASDDNTANSLWENSQTAANHWTLASGVSKNTNPSTSYPGITQSYNFDGTGGGTQSSFASFAGDPSNDNATFEIWFRPSDATGNEILFETGAAGDGVSIVLSDESLQYRVKDSGANIQLSHNIATEIASGEFIQAVGTVDVNTGTVTLYVNGVQVATQTNASIGDWAGGDNAGLGVQNGGINFGTFGAFTGEIASMRFYQSSLETTDVAYRFMETAGSDGLQITQINGSNYTPGSQLTLPSGALLTVEADGSFSFHPTTVAAWQNLDHDDSTTDSFTYTIRDAEGLTATATATITIEGRNDQLQATNLNQTHSYTEDAATVPLDDIVVTDIDNAEIITATLTLNDTSAGILTTSGAATYTPGTGIWTITGTQSDVNIALATVSFTPSSDHDTNTTIDVMISDGNEHGTVSRTGVIQLNVNAVNDPPAIDLDQLDATTAGTAFSGQFVEQQGPVAISTDQVQILDVDDSNIESATIELTNAFAGDVLSVSGTLPTGITLALGSTDTQLLLTGSATLAEYQTAIEQIQFNNPNLDPNFSDRIIHVTVNDGNLNSNTAVATIDMINAPQLLIANATAAEGGQLVFNANFSSPTIDDVTLQFSLANGSATVGTDLEASGFEFSTDGGTNWNSVPATNQITLLSGSTSFLLRVDSTQDTNV